MSQCYLHIGLTVLLFFNVCEKSDFEDITHYPQYRMARIRQVNVFTLLWEECVGVEVC